MRNESEVSYHDLLGFTEDEIKMNFSRSIEKTRNLKSYEQTQQVMDELKKHYNGFLMSSYAENSLYNPYAIQNYFRNDGNLKNYFAESGGTQILYNVLKTQSFEILTQFLRYILNEENKIPIKINEFMKPKRWEALKNDFLQISFDAGHLTLDKQKDNFFLKATNEEMRESFSELIKEFFFNNENYDSLLKTLIEFDFKNFFNFLEKIVFQNKSILNLKDRDKENKDQADYEVFLHQACSIVLKEMAIYAKKNSLIMDYEFYNEKVLNTSEGNEVFKKNIFKILGGLSKIDTYISILTLKKKLYQYLFEYKLFKEKNVRHVLNEALTQIFDKEYYQLFEKFKDKPLKPEKSYIMGVGFSQLEEKIISGILVKIFIGTDNNFGHKENWKIYEEEIYNY